ncbi:MAG: hypothetical protein JO345_30740 [Streptosporangiaceae bacterium]|nr:hypothetical protein [Streptosporangiaceae bacterium]
MSRTSGQAPLPALTRRTVLAAGLGGLAAAGVATGVATAGWAAPAAAATARPRGRLRLSGAGSAAGMNWTGWTRIAPGMVTSNAMACIAGVFGSSVAGFPVWLFATGQDNKIYANTSGDGQNWAGWHEVPGGGQTMMAPTAGFGPNGALVLSVTGLDNSIWLNSTTDGVNWTGWFSIGGQTFTSPLLAEPGVHVYVPGTVDEIFVNSTTDLQNFTGWNVVPGNGLSDVALCLDGFNFAAAGGADVLFAKGLDNRIYYNPVDVTPGVSPSIVGKWTEVPGGGLTDSAPAVAGFSDYIDALLFVKGFQDQRIFVNRADGYPNFGDWEEVPGGGLTDVSLCATGFFNDFGEGPILLFAVGTDGTPFLNMAT